MEHLSNFLFVSQLVLFTLFVANIAKLILSLIIKEN